MKQTLMREEEKKKKKNPRKAHFPALKASDDALMFSLSVKFFFFFFFLPGTTAVTVSEGSTSGLSFLLASCHNCCFLHFPERSGSRRSRSD